MQHSIRGASSAHRWARCAGSIRMSAGAPEQSSIFAAEGTVYHDKMEEVLNTGQITFPSDMSDEAKAEMEKAVVDSLEYLQECGLTRKLCNHFATEERVDYSYWVPEGFGTSDVIAVKGGTLHIADFKYGLGVKVEAEDNLQMQLYALGAYHKYYKQYDFKRVEMHIIQPRMAHYDSWSITLDDLKYFAGWIKERALLTLDPDAPLSPSESACRWCRAKPTCPALFEKTQQVVAAEFQDLSLPSPDSLSEKQIRTVLDSKKLVEGWLKAVEEYVQGELSAGREFAGYKLVEGVSRRQWSDEAEGALVEALGDNAYDKKLIGITAAEKLVGKKALAEMGITVKPEGKPTLAKADDKRPALVSAVEDFSVMED